MHVCTMCAKELILPVSQTRYAHLFDMKDSGDDFYFDNVTAYVRKIMADIEKLPLDDLYKREIRLTANLIELGSELCKVKLHPSESIQEARALADMIDQLLPEYQALWRVRNYEKGVERFSNDLLARRDELRALET